MRGDDPDIALKILVIVHRMATNRLGFGGIYSALNDRTSEGMKQGMQDGTGWPVRPFLTFALPIVAKPAPEVQPAPGARGLCRPTCRGCVARTAHCYVETCRHAGRGRDHHW